MRRLYYVHLFEILQFLIVNNCQQLLCLINIVFYWFCMSTLILSFPYGYLVALLAMIYSIYTFNKTWGSNWCYYVNAILLYYFINILIVMPMYK